MIHLAKTNEEIAACFEAMRPLRPQLVQEQFPAQVRELMAEGYQLACLTQDERVVCVAGFRIQSNFFLGRHLYVEDLSTLEAFRSTGHGARMLDWLRRKAVAERCAALDLDSGVQRHLAHRFYFREGMQIAAYHFLQRLG